MFRLSHLVIIAYLAAFAAMMGGCGFKANPYYSTPSATKGFDDLSALESKME
ncbi:MULTISPECIES: hypothetical protein [unclassified Helicobacter]|uniref:hypothetical protein n=1 Tax=unclassified Helicobacter TaxID=2593540 RepID=UPI0012E83DA2|nr:MULTISPECIES: hypothetical protein [unclassified Helicobacter]